MANRLIVPAYSPQDALGRSVPGAQLFTYEVTSTTDKFTYQDEDATVTNANPVVADGDGVFPDIYLDGAYRMILKDADGNELWDRDNVRAAPVSGSATIEFGYLAEAQAADLTGVQYVHIHSEFESPNDPINGRHVHFTGNVSVPDAGTGTIDLFYDAAGNEYAQDEQQRVKLNIIMTIITSDDPT